MAKKVATSEAVFAEWVERDLSLLASKNRLEPAFEVDDILQQLVDIVASGRHPILCGEPGVGKTAIVQELVLRADKGAGITELAGKRVLELSLRSRLASCSKAEQMRPAMEQLVAALLETDGTVVPYFRDIDVAYQLDLEPLFARLATRLSTPILAEGDAYTVEAMLEGAPDLEHHFVRVVVPEPDLERTERIVQHWTLRQESLGRAFSAPSLSTAVELTHRFLSRAHMPRKAIELLDQTRAVVGPRREVGASDVIDRFYRTYKVPRLLIDPEVSFDPLATERLFAGQVLEQPEAVGAVVRMVSAIKAGLSDPRRPFGAFLFVGPTGVGKTHVAQLLAEYLFGSRERLLRLNMADYQEASHASTLFGNPDAYGASVKRGQLAQRLLGHPFAVILLDEFEKAHPLVQDRFLQLVDEGVFINGVGETVSCRSTIVIATTNAGAEIYREQPLGFAAQLDKAALDRELDRLLLRHFRVELLNRFDQVVHFHPLPRRGIRAVALREIAELRKRSGFRGRALELEVDESVLDWLTAHGYDPLYGARFLRRTIERHVTTALADLLVQDAPASGAHVELVVRSGRISARVAEPATAKEKEAVRLEERGTVKLRHMDRAMLDDEARNVLARTKPLLAALKTRREQRSALLTQMNDPELWADRAETQRILEGYRALDVRVAAETRLASPIERLEELFAQGAATVASELARALERAVEASVRWEDLESEEGPSAVWLVLRNVDALTSSADWIEQLVTMEQNFCRRLQLASELVAFGLSDDKLSKAVIEVEGPGASLYLGMERGVHRLHRSQRGDLRVRVDVVPASPRASSKLRTRMLRRPLEYLGLAAEYAASVHDAASGIDLDLLGADAATLAHLAEDLLSKLEPASGELETARIYAIGGVGARDPRTNARVPRFRDAMAGKLHPLLDAWRKARPRDVLERPSEGRSLP
jgi:ATP-dependent Clp protease ATP-binding subunit ClpA